MPLEVCYCEMSKMEVDAIVNAVDPFKAKDGVADMLLRTAWKEMCEEYEVLGKCVSRTPELTREYQANYKYTIQIASPLWMGGEQNEQEQLVACYKTCLEIAKENGFKSIAFPLIAAGSYGYPMDKVLSVAIDTIREFLSQSDMTVTLNTSNYRPHQISGEEFAEIVAYIADRRQNEVADAPRDCYGTGWDSSMTMTVNYEGMPKALRDKLETEKLSSFSDMLLNMIDRAGKRDPEVYNRAGIDRKLFSRIRCNPDYQPSKKTALAFAIALELDLADAERLLNSAGYSISRSNYFDLIIAYCIEMKEYNFMNVNEKLYDALGCTLT